MRRGASKRPSHAAFSLTNAVAVLPDRVEATTLVVRDGLIHRIDAVHATAARRVDCARDYLLPGLIELHTDNLERHLEPRPGTFWNTDRAMVSHDAELATAGITTAFDAITLGCDVSDAAREAAYLGAIDSLLSAAAENVLRIEHLLHLRCELVSPRLTDYLTTATSARKPDLISLMEHVPGQGQWQDVAKFREHYARRYSLSATELDALIARRKHDQQRFSAQNRSYAIELARRYETILASHDDAIPADVELAAQSGCSIAEFPTSRVAASRARTLGMHVLAGAPNLVRGGSHSGNVSAAALVAENLVDILSSDYCPSSLLQAVFCLARNGTVSLHSAVAMASANPARALHLADRGSIVEGMRADLIRVRDTRLGPIVINAWCGGRQVA
jgi:alpha-D-ribose 1-methylphosphonate 5-triphosphate diphosphatase